MPTLATEDAGWRMFQWLQRTLVPDPTVVDLRRRRHSSVRT
ncbi:MAG: hypothetical protein R2697_00055 [Ilumatobacteraceae bacterium]